MTDIETAICKVVKKGMVVEYNRHHLYFSQHRRAYVLLKFDGKANIVGEEEMVFDTVEEAVETFVDRSKFGG